MRIQVQKPLVNPERLSLNQVKANKGIYRTVGCKVNIFVINTGGNTNQLVYFGDNDSGFGGNIDMWEDADFERLPELNVKFTA